MFKVNNKTEELKNAKIKKSTECTGLSAKKTNKQTIIKKAQIRL
jgi:hypothetical protein